MIREWGREPAALLPGHSARWDQLCLLALLEGPDVQVGPGTVKCQGIVVSLLAPGRGGRVAKEAPGLSSELHVALGCGRQISPLPRTVLDKLPMAQLSELRVSRCGARATLG